MFQGKRIARHNGYLHFNHSCLRKNILPKSLKFQSPINSVAGKKLAKTFGFRYLKLRINDVIYSCLLFAFKPFVLHFSFDCVTNYLYCLTRAFVYY